jgi:hypothetical protein
MDEAQIRAIINEEVRGIINATDREKDPFAGQNAFAGGVSLDELAQRLTELEDFIDDQPDEQFEVIPFDDGGGQSLDGFEIYLAHGTRFHVTNTQAMTSYDPATHNDWSLEFDVTSSSLDDYAEGGSPVAMTNPIGTSTVNEPLGRSCFTMRMQVQTPVAFRLITAYRSSVMESGSALAGRIGKISLWLEAKDP